MSNEYVPTTEEIREAWVIVDEPDTRSTPPLWIGAEFDRWLAAHDAEVAAKALEGAAEQINRDFQALPSWNASYAAGQRSDDWMSGGTRMVIDTINWLNARAATLRAETNEGNDAL